MPNFSLLDYLALFWFLGSWAVYGYVIDHSRWQHRTLSAAMRGQRRRWMHAMARRENRIVDASIMSGLQNGTAFFASTAVLAIGAAFALLNSTDRMIEVFSDLEMPTTAARQIWEVKGMGLLLIYAYAFFKFGWSYRLFNYASILMGAVPTARDVDTPEGWAAVERAAAMANDAGRHFKLGLRAFFFSIGFLGWFAGPVAFFCAATLILAVQALRQFASAPHDAVLITADQAAAMPRPFAPPQGAGKKADDRPASR
ncbi:DUF599 domain-containing protein [Pseudoxanthobacter sp.]|uniref:DUF599 domain-containing protein n=1 Tax=Pseudoxanthobacter sp. TaxID=1925742 RepID=UPI002FDF6BE6